MEKDFSGIATLRFCTGFTSARDKQDCDSVLSPQIPLQNGENSLQKGKEPLFPRKESISKDI